MISILEGFPDDVVAFRATGEVTSDDYRQVLDPAMTAALAAHEKVRVLYVLGGGFTGYSGGAMWQDAVVGTESFSRWDRIAVVTDTDWVRATVHAFAWMMPARMRLFDVADYDAAAAWVVAA